MCLVFNLYLGNGLSLSKVSHSLVYRGGWRDPASVVVREYGGKNTRLLSCYLTNSEQEELLFMHLRSCLFKLALSNQDVEVRYMLSSCKGQSFNPVLAPGWQENPTTKLEADPEA